MGEVPVVRQRGWGSCEDRYSQEDERLTLSGPEMLPGGGEPWGMRNPWRSSSIGLPPEPSFELPASGLLLLLWLCPGASTSEHSLSLCE